MWVLGIVICVAIFLFIKSKGTTGKIRELVSSGDSASLRSWLTAQDRDLPQLINTEDFLLTLNRDIDRLKNSNDIGQSNTTQKYINLQKCREVLEEFGLRIPSLAYLNMPMAAAVKYDCLELFKKIVSRDKIDIKSYRIVPKESQNQDGPTILYWVTSNGARNILKHILQTGVDPNEICSEPNQRPIDIAVMLFRPDLLDIFAEFKADFNYRASGVNLFSVAIIQAIQIIEEGETQAAESSKNLNKVIAKLLKCGCDPMQGTLNPLAVLVMKSSDLAPVYKMLLNAGLRAGVEGSISLDLVDKYCTPEIARLIKSYSNSREDDTESNTPSAGQEKIQLKSPQDVELNLPTLSSMLNTIKRKSS